jgi:hypothetical protein
MSGARAVGINDLEHTAFGVYLGSTYSRLLSERRAAERWGVAGLILAGMLCLGVYALSLPELVQRGMWYALLVIAFALACGVLSGTFYERSFAPVAYVPISCEPWPRLGRIRSLSRLLYPFVRIVFCFSSFIDRVNRSLKDLRLQFDPQSQLLAPLPCNSQDCRTSPLR